MKINKYDVTMVYLIPIIIHFSLSNHFKLFRKCSWMVILFIFAKIYIFIFFRKANQCTTLKETIKKYENHPSIIKIKENVRNGNYFTFNEMTNFDFEREILKLDLKKDDLQGDTPAKMLIKTYDIISNYLNEYYNKAKQEHKYPISLTIADVIPIHKKDEKTQAKIYLPVSLIPVVSKLFERNMHSSTGN